MDARKAEENGHIALTAEQILGADDLPREWAATPEWAPSGTDPTICGVWVSALGATDSAAFQVTVQGADEDLKKMLDVHARFCALVLVSRDGKRLFKEEQLAELGTKNFAVLDRLFHHGMKLNKVSDKDVKELVGNSVRTGDDA